MTVALRRRPHAALDTGHRSLKARKIERLLGEVCSPGGAQLLEVGTGSGVIAAHFVAVVGAMGRVNAVDVTDQRQVTAGYDFQVVTDTTLPFNDATFDICISNHVMEHVGELDAQHHHLSEIHRILRPGGWLYLAVPNRWTLVEPHFKLPLLSWLPPRLADAYVRRAGRGTRYDCTPPSRASALRLLAKAGFAAKDISLEGIRQVAEMETPAGWRRRVFRHPEMWAPPLRFIFPSYIFLARRT